MPDEKEKIYRQIYNALNNFEKILIVSHVRPDGDALGSILSSYRFLKLKGKFVKLHINDNLPDDFKFLPYFDKVESDYRPLLAEKFDVIAVLDCGDFSRSNLDVFLEKISYKPYLINIDHHATNDNFGDCNLVDLEASSTSEVIYDFLKYFKIKIDRKMALALLTGILTDTDVFVNPNTTEKTLRIASELIKIGAKVDIVLKHLHKGRSIKSLKLWGKALARLHLNASNQLATTAIFQDDLEDLNVSDDELSGLANFLNSLDGVRGVMILKEDDFGMIKGSLRTTKDDVDVSEIAKQYGGGGHSKAAGFKIRGRLVRGESGAWKVEQI